MNQINGDASCRRELDSKFRRKRVHLIGYLGKNADHKPVKATDRKYAVLSLATQRSWKGADEEWHSKTWNGLGEYAASKLRKADHIYLEGMLVSSTLRAWRISQATRFDREMIYPFFFAQRKTKKTR